jgi:hypothetical protein
MWGRASQAIPFLCLTLVLGCKGNTAANDGAVDTGGAAAVDNGDDEQPKDPKCLGTPEVVPPESFLTDIGQQSYVVGPEGGMFDMTDEPSVTFVVEPCAVDEPVRFSYLIRNSNPGGGNTDGATVFISFLEGPARLPGNSGFVDLHGDITLIWHDAPSPERAKIWTHGMRGFEPAETTVEGSDVKATTPLVSYLGFGLGE